MPNIYIRLPISRCQFFRNRDEKHILAKHEPIIFNQYMPEYFVMRRSLTNASAMNQVVNTACFSHQQWKNMLSGRHPLGGKVKEKRNPSEYLTYSEVEFLVGHKDYNKSDNEDYLCIKLPNEVNVVDTVRLVTPTWNLDTNGIRNLVYMLNNDFKRSVIEWVLSTFDFCTSNGRVIVRCQSAMLERYLMRYGIEPTEYEKDSLRRVINRWCSSEHNNFRSYSCLDMNYEDSMEMKYPTDNIEWI